MASKDIYFVSAPDNPSFFIALSGHASLLLATDSNTYELYNFSPHDNTSPFGRGAIAQTIDEIHSFDDFEEKCKANDFEGILIGNGETTWHEPYKRAIKLSVTDDRFDRIHAHLEEVKKNPPRFNFFFHNNCVNFCLGALKSGDIYFEDENGNEVVHVFPNVIYERAVGAHNVSSFEKIDFRE